MLSFVTKFCYVALFFALEKLHRVFVLCCVKLCCVKLSYVKLSYIKICYVLLCYVILCRLSCVTLHLCMLLN